MIKRSKYWLCLICLLSFSFLPKAQTNIPINGQTYMIEIIESQTVGTSAVYKRLNIPLFPLNVSVLEIDATAKNIKIETWSGKDYTEGKEHPQEVSNRKTTANHQVLAVINGDFFGSTPCGGEMILGELSQQVVSPEFCVNGTDCAPHIAFDADNKPIMDIMRFLPYVKLQNGEIFDITSFNSTRWENYLVLYNASSGKTKTETNEWGTELLVAPTTGDWMPDINGNIRCKVEKVRPISPAEGALDKMDIVQGKIVLSGHGLARVFLEKVGIGDELFVNWGVTMENNPQLKSASNLIGGNSLILQNGIAAPPGTEDRERLRHPRTSIGYNNEQTKVYFVVVDGRKQGTSIGVSTRELADIMTYVGADNAINLDGGGSSCMVVEGNIKNTPSEKRAVSNGLLLAEIPLLADIIEIPQNDVNITVYSEAVSNTIFFHLQPQKNISALQIHIYNANGKKVKEVCKEKNLKQRRIHTYTCDTKTWNQGTYLYEVIQDGKRYSGKLIIH